MSRPLLRPRKHRRPSSDRQRCTMQIGVLGLGNWGTALAQHLAAKGCNVVGWSVEEDVVRGINADHRNVRYLPHIPLAAGLRATTDLDAAVVEADCLVLVLPSASLSQVLPRVKSRPHALVVSGIKGIDAASGLTPLQCVERWLPQACRRVVLSGPGFAKDIAAQRPAGLVAASHDEAAARETAEMFRSEWMKVYLSDDPLGVELGGIVKNVIAIAAGASDGLSLGDSARAGLITRGLAEMMRLAHAMGAKTQTLSGLSGLGDLVLTATCDASRNRTVGLRLGRGEQLQDIVASLGSTAEGVTTTPLVLKLAEAHAVDMPITAHVDRLLRGEISAAEMARALITRPLKREFYGV